jgi:cell division protease FtsH
LLYGEDEDQGYLGRGGGGPSSGLSADTARLIDSEVRSIIDQCYGTAKQILTDNREKLDAMADALMKYETIDAEQIDDIMAGRTPREPRDWEGGSGTPSTPITPPDVRPEAPIGGPAAEH